MRLTIIGTGYVGLVTGACFAESGNRVTCVDINAAKIEALRQGRIPIYEPGLEEIVVRNIREERLSFSTDLAESAPSADMIYLAVGTPSGDDGNADLTALWSVVEALAPHLAAETIVVVKSTVPVGTNDQIFAKLNELTGRECRVAGNPEFLKEGAAIDDFQKPDRVVVGVRGEEDGERLHRLYAPFLRTEKPFLIMTPTSAEMTKYVANAMLSTKISFINEMANLCEHAGADINEVRRGIGHDARIGFQFLFPGVGYGGSCFPKDVRALAHLAEQYGLEPRMLRAVDQVNSGQKLTLVRKIIDRFGEDLTGRTIAVWGLAFKPATDDIREAPALVLIDELLSRGATLHVHDPEAMANVQQIHGDRLRYAANPLAALAGAEALAINTEWSAYRQPDFAAMRAAMAQPVIFDGRNLYELDQMAEEGFEYFSIGRPSV